MADLKQSVVDTLSKLAFFESVLGENPFKIRAYENGARIIEGLSGHIKDLYENGELAQTKGIGKGILEIVRLVLEQKPVSELDKLQHQIPPSLLTLQQIEGLGPKRIGQLWKELGVSSLGELEYACQENRLSKLKGFGPKLQGSILSSIEHLLQNQHQWRLDQAQEMGNLLLEKALSEPAIKQAMLVGPLVQGEETVSQLDVLLETSLQLSEVSTLLKSPQIPVVFHLASTDKAYQQEAEQLTRVTPYSKTPGAKLIRREDLQGTFHNHTFASDGTASLEDMRLAAIQQGLSYISINDHSKSAYYAHGLSEEDLLRQIHSIHMLNQDALAKKCFLLSGTEADILGDGQLDYPPHILSQLDVVVASVHSRLKQNKEQMTARMVQAALNPQTTIIGHPTGRLLLARQPSDFDIEAFLDACANSGCAVELNSHPQRLDLKAQHVAMAKERGVLICINPDAHTVQGFQDLQYGIYIARKAGLTSYDVLNCRPLADVKKWLQNKQS